MARNPSEVQPRWSSCSDYSRPADWCLHISNTLPAINEPTYISGLASASKLNCIFIHRLFVIFELRTIGTIVVVVFSFSGLMKYDKSDVPLDSRWLVASLINLDTDAHIWDCAERSLERVVETVVILALLQEDTPIVDGRCFNQSCIHIWGYLTRCLAAMCSEGTCSGSEKVPKRAARQQ